MAGLTITKRYPIAMSDYHRTADMRLCYRGDCKYPQLYAVPTGENRAPLVGEWYLSGSVVEAYFASADFESSAVFKIAKLVMGR